METLDLIGKNISRYDSFSGSCKEVHNIDRIEITPTTVFFYGLDAWNKERHLEVAMTTFRELLEAGRTRKWRSGEVDTYVEHHIW